VALTVFLSTSWRRLSTWGQLIEPLASQMRARVQRPDVASVPAAFAHGAATRASTLKKESSGSPPCGPAAVRRANAFTSIRRRAGALPRGLRFGEGHVFEGPFAKCTDPQAHRSQITASIVTQTGRSTVVIHFSQPRDIDAGTLVRGLPCLEAILKREPERE